MQEFIEQLKPAWGSEPWILEGWQQITDDEKQLIKNRLDELFKEGLPFELKHEKILYLYTFSLLAQLEVLAVQIPLKFGNKMSVPEHQQCMRVQLLDEIFHGMVFTKIVYLLSVPHAFPPAYNENIENLCNFIRKEDSPQVAVVLLNLIGEGWIEEIFKSLKKQGIAPKVFTTIIDDEHRHVSEADLYREVGLPDTAKLTEKLYYIEEQLLTNLFLQFNYVLSVSTLLGVEGSIDFLRSLDKKHAQQLNKLNLHPSERWQFFMKLCTKVFPQIQNYGRYNYEIEMTPIRKVFMTQWKNPCDPTMAGQFNLDVSSLDFFNKKFPAETLTTFMLQTVSQGLSKEDSFRAYLNYGKLYLNKKSHVGLIVKLPDCSDHLGTIIFEDCHLFTLQELSLKIRNTLKRMVFCFKKREQIEQKHPELGQIMESLLYESANNFYPYPFPGNSVVSVSNIGFCGYSQAKSPLRINEALKFTLLTVERRPIWNHSTKAFEPRDILPISISADHRIFDGNVPVPKLIASCFEDVFTKMINDFDNPMPKGKNEDSPHFIKQVEELIEANLALGYRALLFLQTYWPEFIQFDKLFK